MTDPEFLIHSNAPWKDGGYGVECNILARKLKQEGYKVHISAFYGLQGKRFIVDDIPVLPGETYSDDSLLGHYKYTGANVLITLMDVFTMIPTLLEPMNVYSWIPVDTDDCLSIQDQVFLQSAPKVRPIAMSRHGHKLLARAGFDALYVPHSIDTNIYRPPTPDEYKEVRRLGGLDDKTFVIGICAANKSQRRKNWDGQLQAFKIFHNSHRNSVLFIHSLHNDQYLRDGVDLRVMCHRYGINQFVKFSEQYPIQAGMVTQAMMARWYWQLAYGGGVLSAASLGEGFGLPSLEAQACGVPVVVTRASAMTEVGKVGWRVRGYYTWVDQHQANWVEPSIDGLVDAYEQAYKQRGDLRTIGDNGLFDQAVAHAQNYSIENVWNKFWKPTIAQMEKDL